MKLKVFSDLHIEFGNIDIERDDADVVIAAGDVGVGLQGIEWLKRFDCPVIYVLGNHDYWGEDYSDFVSQVWQQTSDTNIHFLENDSVVIEGVRFLGCTLWTSYGNANEQIMEGAYHGMNDFRYIKDGNLRLVPGRLLEAHQQSVNWLADTLTEPHDGKTVVVTHHAPSFKSWHREPTDNFRFCYCSNLEPMIADSDIDLWVHGHTHEAADYEIDGVRVYCNPRGYANYDEVEGFFPERVIEI